MANTDRSHTTEQDTVAEPTHASIAPPDQRETGPAADAAVRRLLSRLGVETDGERDAKGVRGMGAHHDDDPKKGKPVDDSEIEALTPREMHMFDKGLQAAIDPNLVAAIKSSGGIVPFMKAIAAGKTVNGVDEARFIELWKTSADEAWLKDKFRAADPGMHEWIPSNQIEEITAKAKESPEGGLWVDLQNELRSLTPHVIFGPQHAKDAPDGKGILLQGHVGALYLNGVMQTVQEAAFHDQLRAAFAAAKDIGDCVDKLKLVMLNWMWTGERLPKPLHPDLQNSVGKPIDEAELQKDRPATFQEIVTLFDTIKAKFSHGPAPKPHKPTKH